MKKVEVIVSAKVRIMWFQNGDKEKIQSLIETNNTDILGNQRKLENEGYLKESHIEIFPVVVIKSVTADGKDITQTKGKYEVLDNYYGGVLGLEDSTFGYITDWGTQETTFGFEVELEDDENFNAKNIHLIKTEENYEFQPYIIPPMSIEYKTKMIDSYSEFSAEWYKQIRGFVVTGKDLKVLWQG